MMRSLHSEYLVYGHDLKVLITVGWIQDRYTLGCPIGCLIISCSPKDWKDVKDRWPLQILTKGLARFSVSSPMRRLRSEELSSNNISCLYCGLNAGTLNFEVTLEGSHLPCSPIGLDMYNKQWGLNRSVWRLLWRSFYSEYLVFKHDLEI